LRASGEVIGLLTCEPDEWFEVEDSSDIAATVEGLLEQRLAARANKDYAEADRIRDELTAMGVVIEDGPDGTRWQLVRS